MKASIPFDKGNNTAADTKRLVPGFLVKSSEWVYMPNDPDRLHKIPGRTSLGAMPSSGAAKGIAYLQFNDGSTDLILQRGTDLFIASASTSSLSWSASQKDLADSPAAWAFNGDNLRATPTGQNRWVLFSGGTERPLIIDEDGNIRKTSLQPAGAVSYPSTIGTLSGTPDPDPTVGGVFTGTADFTLHIEIVDDAPDPETFRYSLDGGSTWVETIDLSLSSTSLDYPNGQPTGLTITWDQTAGYTTGDLWTVAISGGVGLTGLTAQQVAINPTDSLTTTPATVSAGPWGSFSIDWGFDDPANATDFVGSEGPNQTGSFGTVWLNEPLATDWLFSTTTLTLNQRLKIDLSPFGAVNGPLGGVNPRTGRPYTVRATMYVQVTTDAVTGAPATWTTIWTLPVASTPSDRQVLEYALPDGVKYEEVGVRLIVRLEEGAASITNAVWDIWIQSDDVGGANIIPQGDYYYSVTEVFRQELASGTVYEVESLPGEPLKVTVSDDLTYGLKLRLPSSFINTGSDGIKHDPDNNRTLSWKVYRSAASTVWPDMGFIYEADNSAINLVDTFEVTGDEVGTPSLFTVTSNSFGTGAYIVGANQAAPSLHDATLFRGAVVGILRDSRTDIAWSLAGFPEYWPLAAQSYSLLPSERNDKLNGIMTVGDSLLYLASTRVYRTRSLPFADRPAFDLSSWAIDILSPNEGLAGGPNSKCSFQTQKGHPMGMWVSQNGIWMTDGSLPVERGLGVIKATALMDWENTVDTSKLDETVLTYDPVLQVVYFDYTDPDNNRNTITFHIASHHWVPTGQDQLVPKWTGPHPARPIYYRTVGELSGRLQHWSVEHGALPVGNVNELVFVERVGTDDAGSIITSEFETGWIYPMEEDKEFHGMLASFYHSKWARDDIMKITLQFRRDETGIVQTLRKGKVILAGDATTRFPLFRAGQCVKIYGTHTGPTTTLSTPIRAVGPLTMEVLPMGDIEAA